MFTDNSIDAIDPNDIEIRYKNGTIEKTSVNDAYTKFIEHNDTIIKLSWTSVNNYRARAAEIKDLNIIKEACNYFHKSYIDNKRYILIINFSTFVPESKKENNKLYLLSYEIMNIYYLPSNAYNAELNLRNIVLEEFLKY